MGINGLVRKYFQLALNNEEILSILREKHKYLISIRTLKRILRKNGLFRRKYYTDVEQIVSFLRSETFKSGQLHGYRWMHLKCLQKGFVVKRNTIRLILKLVDPRGVSLRKRRRLRRRQYYNGGPNFLWHLDSYDKLKPYGICINGCIDGFSRYILWLKAARTNNDPKVIGGYYYNALLELGGIPRTIRADNGTENGHVEKMQIFLKEENVTRGNSPSFIYGRSTANQRIESWWGILRKHNAQYWINIFQQMKDDQMYDGSFLDRALIQFCFMDIIQKELDLIVLEWNTHKISASRNSIAPTGKPFVMFELPNLFGGRDYITPIRNQDSITVCKEECTFLSYSCDEDVYDLCNMIMGQNHLVKTEDPFDTIDLYNTLRNAIHSSLV